MNPTPHLILCGGGRGDCCYASHDRMAKDRKVLVGVQDVQLPLTLQFISRSKKVRPKKLKIKKNVLFHMKSYEYTMTLTFFSVLIYDFQISWKKGTARTQYF